MEQINVYIELQQLFLSNNDKLHVEDIVNFINQNNLFKTQMKSFFTLKLIASIAYSKPNLLEQIIQILKLIEKINIDLYFFPKNKANEEFTIRSILIYLLLHLSNHIKFDYICDELKFEHQFFLNPIYACKLPDIGYPFYAIQNILNLTDEEKIKFRNGMHSNNEIVQILIDDDIDNLMNLLSTNNINLNKNIPESIFECHNILHYSNPLQYAAFLGAIKCFKYILLNSTNIDYELLLQYAIAGGNYEIIHIVENHCENYQFNQEILNLAILYLHNDLIEYIINNYGININWESYMNCIFASNYEALQILNELANYCDRNQYEIKSNYELQKYFISMISIPFTFGYSTIESIPIDVVKSLSNGEICDILHFIITNVPFNKDFKIFSIIIEENYV